MTMAEILEQAKTLSVQEHKELVKQLVDTLDMSTPDSQAKTGAEIVAFLETSTPIELVDSHIDDPVEWVAAQRRKRREALRQYWQEEP